MNLLNSLQPSIHDCIDLYRHIISCQHLQHRAYATIPLMPFNRDIVNTQWNCQLKVFISESYKSFVSPPVLRYQFKWTIRHVNILRKKKTNKITFVIAIEAHLTNLYDESGYFLPLNKKPVCITHNQTFLMQIFFSTKTSQNTRQEKISDNWTEQHYINQSHRLYIHTLLLYLYGKIEYEHDARIRSFNMNIPIVFMNVRISVCMCHLHHLFSVRRMFERAVVVVFVHVWEKKTHYSF